jgi:hypothetical protein
MGLAVSTKMGELKINSVSMHTAAWRVRDVVELWYDSPLRGEYVTIPGVDGEQVVPMRQAAAQFSLRFVMVGDVDHTGAAYAASGGYSAQAIGMASNMNYLRTNVLTGRTLTGNRTRAATLQVPGEGSTRAADIHCWLVPGGVQNKFLFEGTLEIRIPTGAFL